MTGPAGAAAPGNGRPLLVRLFAHWNHLLAGLSPGGIAPLLRLEQGAGLVRGERAADISRLLEPLLAAAAPRLQVVAPRHLAAASLRPKLHLALSNGGAGLVAELRYFGTVPADGELRAAFAATAPAACPLPPRLSPQGEACLRAVLAEPAREVPLVQVLAGRREVAVPMAAVARAVSEDGVGQAPARTRSLARCLLEEPVPAAAGRPALLLLRRRGEPVALRVELLIGHGIERVLPVGPLLQPLPWLLGVVARPDGPPVPVVDPLALPGV